MIRPGVPCHARCNQNENQAIHIDNAAGTDVPLYINLI